jgi:hypothetical protein
MAICPILKAECTKERCAWWDVDQYRETADCSINKTVEMNKIIVNYVTEIDSKLNFIVNTMSGPRL